MSAKHTPGPWFASGRYIGTFNHKSAICECRSVSGCWSDDEPASANARLIAAAPDLLKSLEGAVIQMDMAGDCIEAGRIDEALLHVRSMMRLHHAAIAKAKGDV